MDELDALAAALGQALKDRKETVAVAESSPETEANKSVSGGGG